jgi:hypothetical protein
VLCRDEAVARVLYYYAWLGAWEAHFAPVAAAAPADRASLCAAIVGVARRMCDGVDDALRRAK